MEKFTEFTSVVVVHGSYAQSINTASIFMLATGTITIFN